MSYRYERAGDSPELRLELTCDDEPLVYCEACSQREFGDERGQSRSMTTPVGVSAYQPAPKALEPSPAVWPGFLSSRKA
jgi:hypothetical protein